MQGEWVLEHGSRPRPLTLAVRADEAAGGEIRDVVGVAHEPAWWGQAKSRVEKERWGQALLSTPIARINRGAVPSAELTRELLVRSDGGRGRLCHATPLRGLRDFACHLGLMSTRLARPERSLADAGACIDATRRFAPPPPPGGASTRLNDAGRQPAVVALIRVFPARLVLADRAAQSSRLEFARVPLRGREAWLPSSSALACSDQVPSIARGARVP